MIAAWVDVKNKTSGQNSIWRHFFLTKSMASSDTCSHMTWIYELSYIWSFIEKKTAKSEKKLLSRVSEGLFVYLEQGSNLQYLICLFRVLLFLLHLIQGLVHMKLRSHTSCCVSY